MSRKWTSSGASNVTVTQTWMRAFHTGYCDGGWWGVLDTVGHRLKLPQLLMRPICDRFEIAVGVPRKELIRMDYNGRAPWWLRR